MEKGCKEIEFGFGNIESAVAELERYAKRGERVYGVFNGKKIYSDIDDVNSAYKKVTGKTKAAFDKELVKEREAYKEQERKHIEAIPELTEEWVEKGREIIDEKYMEKWEKCVPIRLGDLYRGFELGACLDIVKELNKGCSYKKAENIINEQGHSGMSYGLVCSMVRSFCDKGDSFVKFLHLKNNIV